MSIDPATALAAMGGVVDGDIPIPGAMPGEPVICGNCGTPIDPTTGEPIGAAAAALPTMPPGDPGALLG